MRNSWSQQETALPGWYQVQNNNTVYYQVFAVSVGLGNGKSSFLCWN
jgi:hypothetical protein